jgi:hypothetical protein
VTPQLLSNKVLLHLNPASIFLRDALVLRPAGEQLVDACEQTLQLLAHLLNFSFASISARVRVCDFLAALCILPQLSQLRQHVCAVGDDVLGHGASLLSERTVGH